MSAPSTPRAVTTAGPVLTATVALIANYRAPGERTAEQEDWKRPYAHRPKIELAVTRADTLANVLRRAAQGFGLDAPDEYSGDGPWAHGRIAFYRPDDEEGFAERSVPLVYMSHVHLVDDAGRVRFGVSDYRTVSIGDLLGAAEAGTIDGDPLKPYLIVEPGWGDAPPPDWPTVLDGLRVIRDVIEYVALAGGAWAFAERVLKLVRNRLGRGEQTLADHREWAQLGSRPYQFEELVGSRSWRTSELAALLGCGEPEAEAVLWTLGLAFDEESGSWVPANDEPAALIQSLQREIWITSHRGSETWHADLRRRVLILLERGSSPDLEEGFSESERTPELHSSLGTRVGDAIDDLLERIRRRRGTDD